VIVVRNRFQKAFKFSNRTYTARIMSAPKVGWVCCNFSYEYSYTDRMPVWSRINRAEHVPESPETLAGK